MTLVCSALLLCSLLRPPLVSGSASPPLPPLTRLPPSPGAAPAQAGRENQQPQQQQYQQHPRQHQQQLRAAAGAKQQRLSEEGMETDRRSAAATRPVKVGVPV